MKLGWLVNDQLTCIPGTKTFWHDLLENIPGLIDKTNGYTDYSVLPNNIENLYFQSVTKPDYIIRNATYFRKLNINCRTISLLQDVRYDLFQEQLRVCNCSDITVFNSQYIYDIYSSKITSKKIIIPLGTDFNLFKPIKITDEIRNFYNIKENSILYIGSSDFNTKGFNIILDLINNTNYNFVLVMKDDFKIKHDRVVVFNQINHTNLSKIINCCKILICPSNFETLHLAGIEAAACGLPIVATNVGIYYNLLDNNNLCEKAKTLQEFIEKINYIFNNYIIYKPRTMAKSLKLDKDSVMKLWKDIIYE